MGFLQILALLVQIFKALQQSATEQEFRENVSAQLQSREGMTVEGGPAEAQGDFFRLLWEHRDEILAFILQLMETFKSKPRA